MRPIGWLDRVLGRGGAGARGQRARPWRDAVFWALDLETTGLDPVVDHVLSVGMVPIRAGTIRYGERFHRLVRPPLPLDLLSTEGLRAHHILPSDLDTAPPLTALLTELDRRLCEGVLVLHHAPLDLAFLAAGYAAADVAWPRPAAVDTVELLLRAQRLQHRFDPAAPPAPAALALARQAFSLPPHGAHDALADAVATAELFLALVARLDIARAGELY